MESLKSFFSKKKVLITGAHGFKGSWLSLALNTLEAEVIGYGLLNSSSLKFHYLLKESRKKINFIEGNILDQQKLKNIFNEYSPNIVFHLAADPLVSSGYRNPYSLFETNIMGSISVLEVIKNSTNVRAFINVTTDKVYENKIIDKKAHSENDKLGGDDPYSASKACSEIITNSYLQSFFKKQDLGVSTARAGNVIGIGDFAQNRLIPDIIRAELAGRKILIRSPYSVRPWQHVLNPILGYLKLAQSLYLNPNKFSGAYNFGPPETQILTVIDIIKILQNNNLISQEVNFIDNFIKEKEFLSLSSEKSTQLLKWNNNSNLNQDLINIFEGYKILNKNEGIIEFCESLFLDSLNKQI